ncbi:low-density lipoprotein receptor-related protein 12-like, partial [Asterias rubens]|uniref:low-density lipoprotein receptor-related protein 12-like n=1 Tax=Asterias rubens TaxID=7604 RepID=UPI001455762A
CISSFITLVYYFSDNCGQTITINAGGSAEINSQSSYSYDSNQDCTVTIQTSILQRLLVTFDYVDTDGSCDTNFLEIYDGPNLILKKLATVCGYTTSSAYASTLNSLTLRFKTGDNIYFTQGRGFSITLTSFKTGVCGSGDFECDNGRCIDSNLQHDFYDNCGDSSDENYEEIVNNIIGWGIGIIVAVIVGSIAGVVLLAVCCGCLCYHLCCKNNAPRTTTTVVVPPGSQQQQHQLGVYPQQPGGPPPGYNQPPMAMQQHPGQYPPPKM